MYFFDFNRAFHFTELTKFSTNIKRKDKTTYPHLIFTTKFINLSLPVSLSNPALYRANIIRISVKNILTKNLIFFFIFKIYLRDLTTFAGLPKAIEYSGISLVTNELAPIIEPLPIVTPSATTQLAPIQTSSPIVTPPLLSKP